MQSERSVCSVPPSMVEEVERVEGGRWTSCVTIQLN